MQQNIFRAPEYAEYIGYNYVSDGSGYNVIIDEVNFSNASSTERNGDINNCILSLLRCKCKEERIDLSRYNIATCTTMIDAFTVSKSSATSCDELCDIEERIMDYKIELEVYQHYLHCVKASKTADIVVDNCKYSGKWIDTYEPGATYAITTLQHHDYKDRKNLCTKLIRTITIDIDSIKLQIQTKKYQITLLEDEQHDADSRCDYDANNERIYKIKGEIATLINDINELENHTQAYLHYLRNDINLSKNIIIDDIRIPHYLLSDSVNRNIKRLVALDNQFQRVALCKKLIKYAKCINNDYDQNEEITIHDCSLYNSRDKTILFKYYLQKHFLQA